MGFSLVAWGTVQWAVRELVCSTWHCIAALLLVILCFGCYWWWWGVVVLGVAGAFHGSIEDKVTALPVTNGNPGATWECILGFSL